MATKYEKLVEEDINLGRGSVSVSMPGGGSATGSKVGIHTFLGDSVYNVKDYGALGDNKKDDRAAIQSAVDAAIADTNVAMTQAGGVVYFPAGQYRISAAITVRGDGTTTGPLVSLVGQGPRRSVIRNFGTGHAISVDPTWGTVADPPSDYWWFPRIEGLEIVGNSVSGSGVYLSNAHTTVIENCWIHNHGQYGIYATNSYTLTIKDTSVLSCGLAGAYDGIRILSATHFVRLFGVDVGGGTQHGLYSNTLNNSLSVIGCAFSENAGSGIMVGSCNGGIISGCYLEGNGTSGGTTSDIFLWNECAGYTVSGNYLASSAHAAIRCEGVEGIEISANHAANNSNFVVVTTDSKDVHVGKNSSLCATFINDSSSEYSLSVDRNPESGLTYDIRPGKSTGVNIKHHTLASASTGIFDHVGDIIWHSVPVAGGSIGWVCTTAGNPGTWKTFGAISA